MKRFIRHLSPTPYALSPGFTLIELLVVFSVLSILMAISVMSYNAYSNSQAFQASIADFTNTLNIAKSRSISQVKPPECEAKTLTGYAVSFDITNPEYILSVLCGDSDYVLESKSLSPNVNFAEGSATSVLFNVGSGTVSSPVSIALEGSGNAKTIAIGETGNISLEDGTFPTPVSTPTSPPDEPPTASIAPTATAVPATPPPGITPTPTRVPTPTPTRVPTPTPTRAPTPTLTPTPTPTPVPGDGLSAEYFANTSLSGSSVHQRIDRTVDFSWAGSSPGGCIPSTYFSARWKGYVMAKYDEVYTFYTQSDDGVRLWVNNTQLISNWTTHSSTQDQGTIHLLPGKKYPIKMEYFQNNSSAVAKLSWSSPSTAKQIIPRSQLYSGYSYYFDNYSCSY